MYINRRKIINIAIFFCLFFFLPLFGQEHASRVNYDALSNRDSWFNKVREKSALLPKGIDDPVVVVYRKSFRDTHSDFLLFLVPIVQREGTSPIDQVKVEEYNVFVFNIDQKKFIKKKISGKHVKGVVDLWNLSSLLTTGAQYGIESNRQKKLKEIGALHSEDEYYIMSTYRYEGEFFLSGSYMTGMVTVPDLNSNAGLFVNILNKIIARAMVSETTEE